MQVGHRFSVLVGVVEVRGGAGRGGVCGSDAQN